MVKGKGIRSKREEAVRLTLAFPEENLLELIKFLKASLKERTDQTDGPS